MDQLRCCSTMLFFLTGFLTYLVTVSGLECYSCNSLGVSNSNYDEACVTFDKTKVGTEPCQIPEGKLVNARASKALSQLTHHCLIHKQPLETTEPVQCLTGMQSHKMVASRQKKSPMMP
ncbi:uncharacterized protein [Amphiura filiformis]|uniref:uncharacterized protein n=1 Tax=Amphiura filiformis TaxID=82378 RepID=UPI003B220174